MNDSANDIHFVLWCGRSRDSNSNYYSTALWVPHDIHTAWYDCSLCAELGFPLSITISSKSMTLKVTAKKKQERYLGFQFISPSDSRVLKRCCQPTPTPIYIKYFATSGPTETNTASYSNTDINTCLCTAGAHFVLESSLI